VSFVSLRTTLQPRLYESVENNRSVLFGLATPVHGTPNKDIRRWAKLLCHMSSKQKKRKSPSIVLHPQPLHSLFAGLQSIIEIVMVDSHLPLAEIEMTDRQRLILCVRTVLCGSESLDTFDIHTLAQRFKFGISSAQNNRMSTWVPSSFVPILLVGTSTGQNIVITCKDGMAYYMSSMMEVPSLPHGVTLVANCTLDDDESFRVLLYDGENLPAVNQIDTDVSGVNFPVTLNPQERYERLLHFVPKYFHSGEVAKRTFVLQWVGYYDSAREFLTGGIKVGHNIGGLLSITDDPLKPTRPVSVRVPVTNIKRFHVRE